MATSIQICLNSWDILHNHLYSCSFMHVAGAWTRESEVMSIAIVRSARRTESNTKNRVEHRLLGPVVDSLFGDAMSWSSSADWLCLARTRSAFSSAWGRNHKGHWTLPGRRTGERGTQSDDPMNPMIFKH